jgi:aminoglycoside phosphotransferase family enzyme
MSVISPCEASTEALQSLYQMLASSQHLRVALPGAERCLFKIESIQKSESAWVLFVQSSVRAERLVVKVLCDYEDARYKQASIKARQNCQMEALAWNRVFSAPNYYGLARICDLCIEQKEIVLDQTIVHPELQELYPTSDYALVMRKLPQESSLISLLRKEDEVSLQDHIQFLIQRIIHIHEHLTPLSPVESNRWGSIQQLQQKLYHNLALADPELRADKDSQALYSEEVRAAFRSLKVDFHQYFPWELYSNYFSQRVQNNCIKRCHGDLKAPNIWIEPGYASDEERISILDTIDFNPTYCHIDTLSDFATLVIDLQAHTGSIKLADSMIEQYLQATQQQDEISHAVLNYYLFEKAYVGAAISIVYDTLPELGKAYLHVARLRLNTLLPTRHAAAAD